MSGVTPQPPQQQQPSPPPSSSQRTFAQPLDVLSLVQFAPTSEESLRKEILTLVANWLEQNQYTTALWTLREEGGLHDRESENRRKHSRVISQAILEGNWEVVNRLVEQKHIFKSHKPFQYAVARQQYLEIVASKDSQKALAYMMRKLKPLEGIAPEKDFYCLCYLLTCKNVTECAAFRGWDEVSGRVRLLEDHRDLLNSEDASNNPFQAHLNCPPGRLETLLRQAYAFQVLSADPLGVTQQQHGVPSNPSPTPLNASSGDTVSLPHSPASPSIPVRSLLTDYTRQVVTPSRMLFSVTHRGTKCRSVIFTGDRDEYMVTAGHGGDICGWNPQTGTQRFTIQTGEQTTNKVWAMDSTAGGIFATTSSDGFIRMYNTSRPQAGSTSRVSVSPTDLYTCVFARPNWLAVAGYERVASVVDVNTGSVVRTISGAFTQPVTSLAANAYGTLLAAGSKDGKIRVYDVSSGVCIHTFSDPAGGEVGISSIALHGSILAVSHMNSTIRLWDMTAPKILPLRLRGHTNVSKSFLQVRFGFSGDVLYSGSEDGKVRGWKLGSSEQGVAGGSAIVLDPPTAASTPSVVYDVRWSNTLGLLSACSEDGVIRVFST
eukprot:PhF_6_TR34178/c0_g1_i1/m.50015